MSNTKKLLPCPFCKGKALRKTENSCADMQFDDDHDYFWVECEGCGARSKVIHVKNARYRNTCKEEFLKAKTEADDAWNTRI